MPADLDPREAALAARLADERSGEVVFVSHCLLDEHTRYLGGAFRPGSVAEVVAALQARGAGIHQMPCPERHAWGGVLKRRMLAAYGSRGTVVHRLRRPLLALFTARTRLVYRRLARRVVADVEDYERSGVRVAGIVGVGASPSCGVHTTLDLRRSFEAIAAMDPERADRSAVNRLAVVACARAGRGMFVEELDRRLSRRGLSVPFTEHDLLAEMRGERPPLRLG